MKIPIKRSLKDEEREFDSNFPSSDFSTENNFDEDIPESPLIDVTVKKLSRTFDDLDNLTSNVTRARNLWWHKTELEEDEFVEVMEKAAAITKREISKSNIRKSKMAYFFAILEGELGLKDGK